MSQGIKLCFSFKKLVLFQGSLTQQESNLTFRWRSSREFKRVSGKFKSLSRVGLIQQQGGVYGSFSRAACSLVHFHTRFHALQGM